MAIYSDRAHNDPAVQAFFAAYGDMEEEWLREQEVLPDGSRAMMMQAATVIRMTAERRMAEAVARLDADLAARGLRIIETNLDDGAFYVDVVPIA